MVGKVGFGVSVVSHKVSARAGYLLHSLGLLCCIRKQVDCSTQNITRFKFHLMSNSNFEKPLEKQLVINAYLFSFTRDTFVLMLTAIFFLLYDYQKTDCFIVFFIMIALITFTSRTFKSCLQLLQFQCS